MHNMKKLILSVFIFAFGLATATKCPASEYAPYETAFRKHRVKRLEVIIVNYAPAGATKLKVQIQELTRNGQVLLEADGKEPSSSL